MAARKITAARVRLFQEQAGGIAEEVGEVVFSRFPVKSQNDYRCILHDILDLEHAREIAEDIQRHQNDSHGAAGGYPWRR